jgi:hypothetical protein
LKDAVLSIKHIPIRQTDERWVHITEEHCELAGMRLEILETVANPEIILAGGAGELLAVRKFNLGKYLVVVYRELVNDGFIITAFLTKKTNFLKRRKQLWP